MRQQNERQQDAESQISIWTVLPIGFLILLVIGVLIGGILKTTRFGPGIGDIVSFDVALTGFDQTPIMAQRVTLAGEPLGSAPSGGSETCRLRPETMANSGGSLVVEGRQVGDRGSFLVHWAGPRTSPGSEDCGPAADLLVSPTDLLAIAASAGGFGVGHKKLILSSSTFNASTALVE